MDYFIIPELKLNMRCKKEILILKAKERGINSNKKLKKQLAFEIAKYDIEDSNRRWSVISNDYIESTRKF